MLSISIRPLDGSQTGVVCSPLAHAVLAGAEVAFSRSVTTSLAQIGGIDGNDAPRAEVLLEQGTVPSQLVEGTHEVLAVSEFDELTLSGKVDEVASAEHRWPQRQRMY